MFKWCFFTTIYRQNHKAHGCPTQHPNGTNGLGDLRTARDQQPDVVEPFLFGGWHHVGFHHPRKVKTPHRRFAGFPWGEREGSRPPWPTPFSHWTRFEISQMQKPEYNSSMNFSVRDFWAFLNCISACVRITPFKTALKLDVFNPNFTFDCL